MALKRFALFWSLLSPTAHELTKLSLTSATAQTSKPLSSILPRRRQSHSVTDVTDFTAPLALNSDFSRLAENKTLSSKQAGTITFFEMEHVESSTRSLLEGQSYSWLLSGLRL